MNLGAGDDPVASITVTFGGVGVYEFAELYGATQSVEVIREKQSVCEREMPHRWCSKTML